MIVVVIPRNSGILHVARDEVRDTDFTVELACEPEGEEHRRQLRAVFRAESLDDATEMLTASVCKKCRALQEAEQ